MHDLAFLTFVAAILLLYCEFIWVGKIYFGLAGAILLLIALANLWKLPHTTLGLGLIACAVACFLMEAAALSTYHLAGLMGTILLACGAWKLYPAPHTIPAVLAFPASALLGFVSLRLLASARQARRNKTNFID